MALSFIHLSLVSQYIQKNKLPSNVSRVPQKSRIQEDHNISHSLYILYTNTSQKNLQTAGLYFPSVFLKMWAGKRGQVLATWSGSLRIRSSLVGTLPKRLNPCQRGGKINKKQAAGYGSEHGPNPRDSCHLKKGMERVWVKPVSKIRTVETRKEGRRTVENNYCEQEEKR